MKRAFSIILVLSVSFLLVWMAVYAAAPGPGDPDTVTPPPPDKPEAILEVEESIYTAIEAAREDTLFFWDDAISVMGTNISRDQQWAASILMPHNSKTEKSPEKEPALVINSGREHGGHFLAVISRFQFESYRVVLSACETMA